MLKQIKKMLTLEGPNSFEPVVILPVWKSLIVDWLTLFSLGLCRWRWGGITLEEWYDGFTTVQFIADETIGPEEIGICEEVTEHFGGKMNCEVTVSNRTIASLRRFKELLESGEPIKGKRVQIEHTPDGPLTTVEDIVIRGEK